MRNRRPRDWGFLVGACVAATVLFVASVVACDVQIVQLGCPGISSASQGGQGVDRVVVQPLAQAFVLTVAALPAPAFGWRDGPPAPVAELTGSATIPLRV